MSRARGSKVAAVTVTVALGAAVAGCGSSGGTASASPQPATTVTVPPSDGPSAAAASTGAPTPAGTAIGRCHTADLALRTGTVDAGAGQRYLPFGLRNTSTTTCTVAGYVGAQGYGANGAALATTLTRESGTVTTITLKPGAAAYFYLHWSEAADFSPACSAEQMTSVAVTPPDETTQLHATASLQPCKGRLTTAPLTATSR